MNLNIRVLTPDKIIWDAPAEEILLPSSTGQLGILKDHVPLITALDIGVMRLKLTMGETSIFLGGGFAEVENNKITILCNVAQEKNSIDVEATKKELDRVQDLIQTVTTKKEIIQTTIELRKVKARLQAATS